MVVGPEYRSRCPIPDNYVRYRELRHSQPAGWTLRTQRRGDRVQDVCPFRINLSAEDNLRVDISLEIGATSERVVVTAEAPPLKTESTRSIDNNGKEAGERRPLAVAGIGGGMRNAFSIMMMMPQVKSGNGEGAWDDFR